MLLVLAATAWGQEIYYNGIDDDGDPSTHDLDADGDGFLCDPQTNVDCEDVNTTVPIGDRTDCDDANDAIHPDAAEVCDVGTQMDDDCDGNVNTDSGAYFDVQVPNSFGPVYLDADDDGYGTDEEAWLCELAPTWASQAGDCNDHDAHIFPGAPELCNSTPGNDKDDDCDGEVDEPEFTTDWPSNCFYYYQDADGDGFGDATAEDPLTDLACVCEYYYDPNNPLGATHLCNGSDFDVLIGGVCFTQDNTDCDDADDTIHPVPVTERVETIDGIDNDCNGEVPIIEVDCDGDGAYPSPVGEVEQASDVDGLVDCRDLTDPSDTVSCGGAQIHLTCDSVTGLRVASTAILENIGLFDGHERVGQSDVCGPLEDCDDWDPGCCDCDAVAYNGDAVPEPSCLPPPVDTGDTADPADTADTGDIEPKSTGKRCAHGTGGLWWLALVALFVRSGRRASAGSR